MDAKPTARHDGLIIEELGTGVVIYDSVTQEAHALDAQAASVWHAADGRRTVSELASTTGLQEPVVIAALDQLQARGLLTPDSSVSRRAMLRRSATLGAAAIAAAPLVETVLIPTAAAHASTVGPTPPTHPLLLAIITPDEMSTVVTIPTGLIGPGRFLVRRGNTTNFAPNPFGVFGITTEINNFVFRNDTANDPSSPAYHFLLVGVDGHGNRVHSVVAGISQLYTEIALGPHLNVLVYYVPGVS